MDKNCELFMCSLTAKLSEERKEVIVKCYLAFTKLSGIKAQQPVVSLTFSVANKHQKI